MANVGIITQARMTSTRLPGKVLLEASGKTVLEHHIERLSWSNIPAYVATTTNASDDPIVALSKRLNVPVSRGSEANVLERFYQCAQQFKLDVIIRVTSDCPLIDGRFIKEAYSDYAKWGNDLVYYSNSLERTFPRGLDFEIFSMRLLEDAYNHAQDAFDIEHVTPYINRNKSGKVLVRHFLYREDHSDLRWTLDTPDDWQLIRTLIEKHAADRKTFEEILGVVNSIDELRFINSHIKQKEN